MEWRVSSGGNCVILEGCFKLQLYRNIWQLFVQTSRRMDGTWLSSPCFTLSSLAKLNWSVLGSLFLFLFNMKLSICIILLLFLTWLKVFSVKPRLRLAELPSTRMSSHYTLSPFPPCGCFTSNSFSSQLGVWNTHIWDRRCWSHSVSQAVGELNHTAHDAKLPLLLRALDLAWSAAAFQFGEFKWPSR